MLHSVLTLPQDYLKLNYYRMRALQNDDATKLSATLHILLETEVRNRVYQRRSPRQQWGWATNWAAYVRGGELEAAWSFSSLASDLLQSIGNFLLTGVDKAIADPDQLDPKTCRNLRDVCGRPVFRQFIT